MLEPLKYERVSTLDDPSEGLGSRPGALSGGPGAPRSRTGGLHPLHWLVEGHWLGRFRTDRLLKIWRYSAGSIVAFVASTVTFYVCIGWFGEGAISATFIAFFAGAVPNWVLNRRWAWEKRGREGITRETILYVVVSLVSLGVSSAITKGTALEAQDLSALHAVKAVLVTGSYVLSVVLLSGLKYLAYDRFVFVERRRSRAQVPTTTEPNRQP
jgi:putative flippase GtrA